MVFFIVCILIAFIVIALLSSAENPGAVNRNRRTVYRNTGSRGSQWHSITDTANTDSMYMFASNRTLYGDSSSSAGPDGDACCEEGGGENCDCGCSDNEFDGDSGDHCDCSEGYDSDGGYDSGDCCNSDSDSDSDSD